jgi:hypothetical protein
MSKLPRRCEAQTGHRHVVWLNAVSIPRAMFCPNAASSGRPFCPEHDTRNPGGPA